MSRTRIIAPTLLALALFMAWPLGAGAEVVPPGNSEVNQYTETLPGPTNDRTVEPPEAPGTPGGQGSAGGGPGGGVIPDDTARELRQFGPDGRAAAALAQSNAPVAAAADAGGGGDVGGRSASGGNPDSFFNGLLSAVTGTDDDGGLGILMLLILLGVAAAGVGHAVLRRRARQAG